MDTTAIIIMSLAVLLVFGVGLIWFKKKGPGSYEGRVGDTEFKITNKGQQKNNQAEHVQKEAVCSTQEQPKGANAKQVQEKKPRAANKSSANDTRPSRTLYGP